MTKNVMAQLLSFINPVVAINSGAINPSKTSFVKLNNTTKIEMTIAKPVPGHLLIITQLDTGTAGHTVTLTSGVYNAASNTVATFNAKGETLVLLGLDSSTYIIIANVGSVGLG